MLKEDEEFEKRKERARLLRNSVGMITNNDLESNSTLAFDDDFQSKLNRAKELRNSVGMITNNDLEQPEESLNNINNSQDYDFNLSEEANLIEELDTNQIEKTEKPVMADNINNTENNTELKERVNVLLNGNKPSNLLTDEEKIEQQKAKEQSKQIAQETNSDKNLFSQIGKTIENLWLGITSNAKAGAKYITAPQYPEYIEKRRIPIAKDRDLVLTGYLNESSENDLILNKIKKQTEFNKNLQGLKNGDTFAWAKKQPTLADAGIISKEEENKINQNLEKSLEKYKDANGNIELNSLQRELSKSIVEEQNKIASNVNKIDNPIMKKLAELAPSTGNTIAGAGLSIINPYLGMEYFMITASGMYEAEGRARGMSKAEARAYGTIMGYAEGATEMIQVSDFLKAGKSFREFLKAGNSYKKAAIKEAIKHYGLDMADNAVQEAIIDPIDELTAQLTSGKTKHDYSKNQGWNELLNDMVQDGIDGALSSLLLNGIDIGINSSVNLYNKIKNNIQPTKQDILNTYTDIQNNPNINVTQHVKDSMEYQKQKILNGDNQVYSVIELDQNGNVTGITQAAGSPIELQDKNLNINPAVIYTDGYYNVIDTDSGLKLDTTLYDSKEDAIKGFNDIINKADNATIDNVNDQITKTKLALIEKMQYMRNKILANPEEAQKQNKISFVDDNKIYSTQETANILNKYDINQNLNNRPYLGQEINDIINANIAQSSQMENIGTFNNETPNYTTENVKTEYEQNNENKIPEKSKFYEEKPNYAVSNINEIETELNKKNSYSLEQIGETWSDIQENTYNLTLNDNMYVELEEDNGKLEAVLYDGSTEEIPEVNRVAVEKTKNGRYTAEAINNAIKEVATIPNENSPIQGQVDIEGNIVNNSDNDIDKTDNKIRNIVKYNQDGREITDVNYVDYMVKRYKDHKNISNIKTDTKLVSDLLKETFEDAKKIIEKNDEKSIRNKQKILMIEELYPKIQDTEFEVTKKLQTEDGKYHDIKLNIEISKNGVKESFNKSISEEKYAIVPYLDIIIKTSDDGIVRNESKNRRNIEAWYYLYNTAEVNGNLYTVKLDIKKTNQGDKFYVHRLHIIKEGSNTSVSNVKDVTKRSDLKPSSITNSISQKNKNVKIEKNTISNNSMQNKEKNTNIQDFGEKIGGARKDLSIPRINTKPGKEVIHDYTVQNTENGYSVNFKGKVLNDGFKTQAEAEQYILDFKNNIKNNRAFVEERNSLLMTGGNKYSVYLRNPRTLKSQYTGKSFANKQDAENYAMALSMYLKENGKNLFRPQIQKVDRVNANNKNATKATGDDILKNFGFKGGEFGNWVTQNERQQFLNYAQDAFTDLAAALDVTPDSLGQKGAMSIAFGARGQGLTGAVAHFEPGKKVINMTRLKGAGSLAHEYGHSIDNYLSRVGGYNEDGMATENLRNPKLSDNMKKVINEVIDSIRYNVSTNQEEIDKKNAIYEKNRISNVEYNLGYLDKVFNGKANKYKKIKGKYELVPIEVTDKQKSEYQKIRKTLVEGKLKGDIDYKLNGQTLKTDKTYPEPLNTLQNMYKEVVGRKLEDDTVYSLYRQGKPARQVTEVKSESAFSKSALELDKAMGRSTAYYSKIAEMWARAFESYVSDKLKAKGIKDTYLVHSVNNNEYALFNPFPAGEERKNINNAFDNLIQTMKDEGLFTSSGTPQNIDNDTGIRYMKKNKVSKQSLAKQFENITGDSINKASAKLAGIELRNAQRQNNNLSGEFEENPYSKEAMDIYNKYNSNKKSSSYLYHSTPRKNLQSIIENGLTTGNKQNQEGISSKDKIYLSATEELAESFTPDDSVTLRLNPKAKLENLESDLLGGEGSYSITNNIPANMLQIKENGKWVSLNNISNKENIRLAKNNKEDNAIRNAERGESYIEQEIQKIEQTGDWDNSIPITKLTDIRKTIEDYLGLGIKKGHFRQDAYALYKGKNDVIRTKEYKDMDSILHETGHAMDLGNRLKIDKESIADELLTAIDKLGGYEEETRTVKLEEGFAEVIREYSIIPNQAKIDYPQTVAILEGLRKTDKKFNDFITKVQQQSYNYIHQNPRNRTLSNISIGEQTDKQNITKNYIKQKVMRNIYDRDYVVKSAVNELAKANGKTAKQIKASENAYYLTRLASGKTDKVISMLSDGYIDEHGKKLMPGLNGIGNILGNDTQRWNDLRAYLVAQRDLEYKAKTLKTGIRTMDSKAVIDQFKNDKQIQQAAKLVYDTLDGVMQYTVDNGLISQETADKLKQSNAFYVPMHRVLDNRGNQVGRRGAVADLIQKRTGSELDVKDVLENIIANSSNMIQQVENNNILRALYKEGQTTGLTGTIYDVIDTPLTKIGTAKLSTWENELKKQGVNTADLDLEKTIDLFAPNNKIDAQNLITSFINESGKRIYLQFNDELLFNSLMNMDKKFMSQVLKINSKMNMPLRYGATMANLGFAIPNMISDTAQAAVYSTAGFIPVVDNALGVLDILAATNKTVKNFVNSVAPEYAKRINNLYSLYQQSGATSSTRMSQYRESTQNLMADVYGTKSKTLGIKEKYKPLKRLLDVLTYIPEISEQSTRFRVFEKNYDMYKNKGTAETDARILAALESRDATQDFGRTGNITREINQLIPFSAARVGSAYTFAEKLKANPKQVGMRIALLTTLAMAIKAMGYDDDEIDELNQRKKDDNFVMRAGDKIVTIKKPQGILRSIVNLAEYIQDLATDHIEEGKEGERLGEWLHNTLTDNLPADNVLAAVGSSTFFGGFAEYIANKDFYYNTDIVKNYDLDLPDPEQYYEYNSQLSIWLGKIFNQSPAKIDNLISSWFGGLGTSVTGAIDYTLGKAGVIPEKPEMGAEQDTIGKRFIVNVNTNSASIDEIYNRKTELTKLQNGGTITAEEEEELKTIKSAISNMSDLNKQIKEIKKDLTMSGTEKAEKIRVLQQEKTDTARKALGKDLIHADNETKIQSTQFYPNDTLKKNGYSLTLNSAQKKEYEQIANDYYTKYEKQGLYSQEKLEDIKSKAKDYAKNQMFKKYRTSLVKTK